MNIFGAPTLVQAQSALQRTVLHFEKIFFFTVLVFNTKPGEEDLWPPPRRPGKQINKPKTLQIHV